MVESNNCSFEEKNVCLCGLTANDGIPIPLLHLMCSLCLPRLSCQWYWMHPRRYDNPVTIGWFTDFTVSIGCSPYKYTLVGGFNPPEKYESQIGSSQLLGKIKAMFETTNQYLPISAVHRESQTFICPGYPVLPIIGGIKTEAPQKKRRFPCFVDQVLISMHQPPQKKWWFEIPIFIHGWHAWLILVS